MEVQLDHCHQLPPRPPAYLSPCLRSTPSFSHTSLRCSPLPPAGTAAILAVGGSKPVVTVDDNGRIGVEKQVREEAGRGAGGGGWSWVVVGTGPHPC